MQTKLSKPEGHVPCNAAIPKNVHESPNNLELIFDSTF